jgi:hypothetical protein
MNDDISPYWYGLDDLSRDQLLEHLQNIGFEAYIPRTSSWTYAFIASKNRQTIYFLVGKRRIDFKFYDTIRETKVDEKGKLYTDGGKLVRNYYENSVVNIHELIWTIASRFISGNYIDDALFSGNGTSWKDRKAEYERNLPKGQMQEIYEAISIGDGEDAYLGDGVWVSSDGEIYDRERQL